MRRFLAAAISLLACGDTDPPSEDAAGGGSATGTAEVTISATSCDCLDDGTVFDFSCEDHGRLVDAYGAVQGLAEQYLEAHGVDPSSPAGQVIHPYVVGTTIADGSWDFRTVFGPPGCGAVK